MSAPDALVVEGLRKTFDVRDARGRRARLTAVDGVDLRVPARACVALVGASGCGKSTLARCALRLEAPDDGRIAIDGVSWFVGPGYGDDAARRRMPRARALRRLRRRAQMVFQDSDQAFDPRQRVADILAAPLDLHGLARGTARRPRLEALLRDVALDPAAL
ncbi:MAG: ATP-binding cassette domain-containing protein, partial [Acidobacteriota bacterium]